MKLVTRAQLGWPASAAPSQASTRGVKIHYEGTIVSTKLLTDHGLCLARWKAIRASHLANKTENYSDVAYNYAACPHGYLLEGRGLGKRTGANGNQSLNQAHYAIVGLVGSSGLTQPTNAMLSAIRDGIELLRKHGAGNEIKGHRDGFATACPGTPLYAWVQKGAPRPTATTLPTEDNVPLTDADLTKIADRVLKHDGVIKVPGAASSNPTWTLSSVQTEILTRLDKANASIAALSTANSKLVDAVAKLAADVGDLDPAAIVAELTRAIESVEVRLDVTDA